MKTYIRLSCVLVACLLLLVTPPIKAAGDGSCKEAARWYNELDPNDQLAESFTIAVSGKTTKARAAAAKVFNDAANAIIESSPPLCLIVPFTSYVSGLAILEKALEDHQNDTGNYSIELAIALQRIGEFRGYMTAIGVDVYTKKDVLLYFR